MVIKNILNITKKEIKELSKNKAFLMYYLYIILLAGVVIPLFTEFNTGIWGVSIYLLIIVCFIGIIIPSTLVSDSFAGEKERKTLETLISTPITIFDLFMGKVVFIIAITEIVLAIVYLLNLITYNMISLIQVGSLCIPFTAVSQLIFWETSFAITCFVTFWGSMISIHSKNVKSCNLVVMLISSPILVPILYILNQEILITQGIRSLNLILIGLTILLGGYVKVIMTKVKTMSKIR